MMKWSQPFEDLEKEHLEEKKATRSKTWRIKSAGCGWRQVHM